MSTALVIAAVIAVWAGIALLSVCACRMGSIADREVEKQFDARQASRDRREYRTGSGWKA